ncbi:pyridoxamine 5'-phosphate oxidase family protein [Halolamina sp.]|jgi:nitroimidazol reductase NimA-like FMN-containing flavoprotein (pyridoxamine 5'-phosphate oxidase superfamily)|uniref:pyridoxamine 5'-phosphate oxidase family protein n=1 Tax=Halolamina sp. TaxID=1940283 RepID=UPI000223B8D3|nr:pyridoxamine 5'-phosphate oxidase-related FMN-binding protein [halophilic archaeon DL31]
MAVPPEIETLIANARLSAHVATSLGDRPHVAPVWYLYDDGVVSFVTSGRKLRNLRENHRVALSIEKVDESGVEWTVTMLGTATVSDDPERVDPFQRRIDEKYDNETEYGFQPLVEVEVASATHTVY